LFRHSSLALDIYFFFPSCAFSLHFLEEEDSFTIQLEEHGMNKRVAPMIGFGLLALSVSVFVSGQNSGQARTALQKGASADVLKLAAAIKAGDKDAVKTQATALAKLDMDEVMDVFKPRSKGGIGVGKDKGKIIPDGIELKLQTMGRDAPSAAVLTKEGDALEEMAYVIAAVAEVAAIKGAPGGKQKDNWATWSKEMKEASSGLTKAVKSKGGAEVKSISTKINNNCAACHAVFKAS
jgi:hypothetical protein